MIGKRCAGNGTFPPDPPADPEGRAAAGRRVGNSAGLCRSTVPSAARRTGERHLHSRGVTSEGATAQNVKSATFSVFFYRRKLCPRKKIGHKRRDVSRKKLDFCEICVIILTEADETDSIRTSPAWKLFRKLEVNATQMLTHSMYRPFKKAYLSAGAVAAASGNPFNSLLCSGRWCDETPRRASKMLTAFGGSHEHHEEAD